MVNQQSAQPNMSSGVPLPLLTAKEAARVLSISERTLWTLTNSGTLKSIRIGRAVRYAVDDLQAYINHNRTDGLEYTKQQSTCEGNSHGQP